MGKVVQEPKLHIGLFNHMSLPEKELYILMVKEDILGTVHLGCCEKHNALNYNSCWLTCGPPNLSQLIKKC